MGRKSTLFDDNPTPLRSGDFVAISSTPTLTNTFDAANRLVTIQNPKSV